MRFSALLACCLAVLVTVMGLKLLQIRDDVSDRLGAASAELLEAEEVARGLLDRIQQLRPPPYSLSGVDAVSGQPLSIDPIDSFVVYYLGTDCPFSRLNVPFLNAVHGWAGVEVVGIAPEERRPAMAGFAETAGTRFPLLVDPEGGAVEVLPDIGVPVTIAFLDGRIRVMWLGEITADRQYDLAGMYGVRRD